VRVRRQLTSATAWGCLLAGFLVGGCAAADASNGAAPPAASATATPKGPAHPDLSSYRSPRTHTAVALPVRLRIPAIGVDTGLQKLGLARDGSIEVPSDPMSAGWWAQGPRPGQAGPAVILGHVTYDRHAVFFRLGDLQPGDDVLVDRSDGSTVRFEVTRQGTFEKTVFPSDLVYYPTLESELRLVTCGGPIDPTTGRYRDNVVVFAEQGSS
jgi:Sortase domain